MNGQPTRGEVIERLECRMIGRTYLERGRPVVVLTRWGPGGGPRNVAIRREDGQVVVRQFRGLRKPKDVPAQGGAAQGDNQ
jgi:acetyl esterase